MLTSMTTTAMRPSPSRSPARVLAARRSSNRRRQLLGDLLVVLVWASAAASLGLYFASGLVALTSAANVLTTLGIATGLVGSDLVLVMLVLASRMPLIDRTVGHDRAMGLHRQLGKPAFYLLIAHGVLLTIGYSMSINSNVIAQTFAFLGSNDMILAYLSFGLFVAVIVTSLVAVKRRFPYEFWHVIHLLSYAAVLAALPHMLGQGQLLASGWQRWYWIMLYALAFGSIVGYRFVSPASASIRHRMHVERVERIAPDAFSIHLRGRNLDKLGMMGGQFLIWRFWTPRTWWHAHPISLSASPGKNSARVTIRIVGKGTRSLAAIPVGTPVSFSGPFGLFTDAVRSSRHVAIIAAGIGITPVVSLIERLDLSVGDATVLVRASSEDQVYLWDELNNIERQRGIKVYTSVGSRGRGAGGWMAARDETRGVNMLSVFPHLAESDVFICGPDAWAQLVEDDARARGVGASCIHREKFDW